MGRYFSQKKHHAQTPNFVQGESTAICDYSGCKISYINKSLFEPDFQADFNKIII